MRTYLILILVFAVIGCSNSPSPALPASIETPDGTIEVYEATVAPVPQKISVVRGNDLMRLLSLGEQGPEFVATYLPGTSNPDLKDYDRAFRAWQLSKAPQHTSEQVAEILGGYLGNKCISDFDLEWVSVTDELGTEYGIRSKSVELLAFPFSTVRKRIEDKTFDFLYGVYHTIKHTLATGDFKTRDPEPGING